MGFAELSIAQIAEEYNLPLEEVFQLCKQREIRYKNEHTCLALEDAKAIISQILSDRQGSTSQQTTGES